MLNTTLALMKKPSRKRTFRTNTLARELKQMGYPFDFYNIDTISFEVKSPVDKSLYFLEITGCLDCYKMKMLRKEAAFGQITHRYKWELRATTGIELLINLVQRNILPPYFMPITSIQRLTDES